MELRHDATDHSSQADANCLSVQKHYNSQHSCRFRRGVSGERTGGDRRADDNPMNRHLLSLAAMVFGGVVWAHPADAAVGKRVALVLGNSAYQNVAKLPNPSKDASAIGKMLKDAGFEVIQQQDVGNLEFKRAIRRFGDAMVDADIAVVFYAGHGIEVRGHQLSHSGGCQACERSRCRGRGGFARSSRAGDRGRRRHGQAIAADHSRCLPGQSIRQDDEAGALRPRPGRARPPLPTD